MTYCWLQLEDLELVVADHVHKVMAPSFSAAWEEVGPDNEMEETYALSTMKTLEGRASRVHGFLMFMYKFWLLCRSGQEHRAGYGNASVRALRQGSGRKELAFAVSSRHVQRYELL